jgi:hypothetical protein
VKQRACGRPKAMSDMRPAIAADVAQGKIQSVFGKGSPWTQRCEYQRTTPSGPPGRIQTIAYRVRNISLSGPFSSLDTRILTQPRTLLRNS